LPVTIPITRVVERWIEEKILFPGTSSPQTFRIWRNASMKINALVVDDSKVMRSLVIRSLDRTELADFNYIEAEDGEDALKKFNPDTVDIIFADWNMPKMSGIAFAKEVRGMEKTKAIPIVMVTSEKSMGKIEVALDQVGANAYVTKPFTAEELKSKIEKLVVAIVRVKSGSKEGGFFKSLMG
jgi:two-component system, chemotaxis family, chemotaxis protein CheY